jgi:hypothetical protein
VKKFNDVNGMEIKDLSLSEYSRLYLFGFEGTTFHQRNNGISSSGDSCSWLAAGRFRSVVPVVAGFSIGSWYVGQYRVNL